MQFAKHICASALQEEHGNVSSSSAPSTWCLGLGPVSSVMINVFVAMCAAEQSSRGSGGCLQGLSWQIFFVFLVSFSHFVSSTLPWAPVLPLQPCWCDLLYVQRRLFSAGLANCKCDLLTNVPKFAVPLKKKTKVMNIVCGFLVWHVW